MVSAKWVFRWKYDETGKGVKAKARLAGRGFSQRPGGDYHETFNPTPAAPCIRLMTAIACELQTMCDMLTYNRRLPRTS